jgi:hypothetical protein
VPSNDTDLNDRVLAMMARFSGPKPPRHAMNVPLDAEMLSYIGLIIVQWTNVCTLIQQEMSLLSPDHAVPLDLRAGPLRREMKYEIEHLKKLAGYVYQGGRAGGLDLYFRNLDKIMQIKDLRDGLAHGEYHASKNYDPSVLVVMFRGEFRRYTRQRLASISYAAGETAAFLLNFSSWHFYENQKIGMEAFFARKHSEDQA